MGQLENLMKLGMTEAEAKEILAEDAQIDKMSMADAVADLSEDQKKASKEARQATRKPTVYKFDTSKKTRAENPAKRELIQLLSEAVGVEVNVTNPEREFEFVRDGVKYKVTLACPRK